MSMQQESQTSASTEGVDERVLAVAAERVLNAVAEALHEPLWSTPPSRQTPAAQEALASPPGEAIADLHEELDAVQAELSQVTTGVVALQSNSLRVTGVAALVLAVLIAVAWKVVGG